MDAVFYPSNYQKVSVEKTGNFTAETHGRYNITATATVTDPTPAQGMEYICFVRNGTATIGGTAYATGTNILRSYHSGSWANSVLVSLSGATPLTAARIPFAAAGGFLTDSASLSWSGTLLTVTGGITMAGALSGATTLTASIGVIADRAASNTALSGPYVQFLDSAGGKGGSWQVGTATLDLWNYNGGWGKVLSFAQSGGAATFSAGISCTTLTANAGGAAQSNINVGSSSASTWGALNLLNGPTHRAWMVSAQNNINEALEFTPSTAAGGATFTTAAFVCTSPDHGNGLGAYSNGYFKVLGTTASTSTTTGAVVIGGGLGVAGDGWFSSVNTTSGVQIIKAGSDTVGAGPYISFGDSSVKSIWQQGSAACSLFLWDGSGWNTALTIANATRVATFASGASFGASVAISQSSASVVQATIQNTAAGTGAYSRLTVSNDVSTACAFQVLSSTYSGSLFGVPRANAVELMTSGASASAFVIGAASVNIPIVFGINTSEVARLTSGTLASGSLDVKYTGQTSIKTAGQINMATLTPASASATGTAGTIAWDASYIYVCTATNTWKRVAIATW